MDYKIKILKDTPFDKKGVKLSILDFSRKYNYLYTGSMSNIDVINHLKRERKFYNENITPIDNNYIGSWFEVIEEPVIQEYTLYIVPNKTNVRDDYYVVSCNDSVKAGEYWYNSFNNKIFFTISDISNQSNRLIAYYGDSKYPIPTISFNGYHSTLGADFDHLDEIPSYDKPGFLKAKKLYYNKPVITYNIRGYVTSENKYFLITDVIKSEPKPY